MANPIIQAGGLFSTRFMEVTFLDLRLGEPHGTHPGGRRVSYRQIDCVLLSATDQLTLQMGADFFSIPINPNDAKHQEALTALTAALERS